MARWEPDARGRLERAAMDLFRERGYPDVTVSEIADRAGLTKRTFFNHFADKREVFFANAAMFRQSVLTHLGDAGPELTAVEAAVSALTRCGLDLAGAVSPEDARTRLDVLAVTPELRERDLIKTHELTVAMVAALVARGASAREAGFAVQAGLMVFNVAIPDWLADPAADFPELMRAALADLRDAVGVP
ncbi:TetR family transcriptional regulator [Paractinoplanes abujensis]|uniref:AcrR family transcriptional regulator n=1 Tax=Paractinoplanes abujensis TaxID=882441 RepID=A0A7W7FYS0_9ACTN|nr:TetR/AcrR family transcriptional regulator [Actinoplanes abujensis]MBB4691313.1 AcrR family transcriptional regulator [Actinoplanes abujensis]GID17272.1 TetR family transcriptional regulator [Actinoplanes abujensis]